MELTLFQLESEPFRRYSKIRIAQWNIKKKRKNIIHIVSYHYISCDLLVSLTLAQDIREAIFFTGQ